MVLVRSEMRYELRLALVLAGFLVMGGIPSGWLDATPISARVAPDGAALAPARTLDQGITPNAGIGWSFGDNLEGRLGRGTVNAVGAAPFTTPAKMVSEAGSVPFSNLVAVAAGLG